MEKINIKDGLIGKKKFFAIGTDISSEHVHELKNCLEQYNGILTSDLANSAIYKLLVFVKCDSVGEFFEIKSQLENIIQSQFKAGAPYFAIIPQMPADGSNVAIEVCTLTLNPESYSMETRELNGGKYSILTQGESIELAATIGSTNMEPTNAYEQSLNSFVFGQQVLKMHGLNWNDIVRQWMYLGKINKFEEFKDVPTENYQMFNIARAQFYKQCLWYNGFPSATGIGADIAGSFLEFTATNEIPGKLIVPLRNPRQIDAHSYTEKYVPSHQSYEVSDNKPKFERGKAVLWDNFLEIYISGTAAILGEDSIPGDIRNQTETTIDNIHRVASPDNLKQSGIEILGNLPQFSMARAYIKYDKDAGIVEQICKEKFGNIPITYVIADVCRKELLVEIEAYLSVAVEKI